MIGRLKHAIAAVLIALPGLSASATEMELRVGGEVVRFSVAPDVRVDKTDSGMLAHGDVTFLLEPSDVLISPNGSNNMQPPPKGAPKFWELQWGKFAAAGYTAILKDLNGAGCVVIIEEFGDDPPYVKPAKGGIVVADCAVVRLVAFDSGGYCRVAAIMRSWLKQKGHYRNIFDKPLGKEIAGAAAMRPVQHGAISAEVWEQLQPLIPSAVLVWRGSGGPGEGLEHFTPELQARLDKAGKYFFLPWGSMLTPISVEEDAEGAAALDFSKMPREMIESWSLEDADGNQLKPMVGHGGGKPKKLATNGLLCHSAQAARMEHWLGKVVKHPSNYRMDGVNMDSSAYYLKARDYPGNCENAAHPATFKDRVAGLQAMFKTAYDRGLMVSHEGNVFFLEKYSLHTYGRSMVSLGIYTGWHLLPDGADKDPNKVVTTITKHLPVNEMIYHDQVAMRIHDAEALNIRYATKEQAERIRCVKHVFNALYGLTPNLQLGGPAADRLVTEDLDWIKVEMPRALGTYRLLYGREIIGHEFLTKDRLVQRTQYEGGVSVLANFSDEPRTVDGVEIPAWDYHPAR